MSVDMYNDWFIRFAPRAYRAMRERTAKDVESTLEATNNLTNVTVASLRANPAALSALRMSASPPLAVDRLAGLAGVSSHLIKTMEKKGRLPP